MKKTRAFINRKTTLLANSWLIALLFNTTAQANPLQAIDDFQQLATLMQETRKPLVLAFDAEHCNYCARLKAEQLQPMENNVGYREKIFIRTLAFSGTHEIKDFDGQTLSASAFSNKYKVYVTPTLLFLGAHGEEIAERMLGYNTPDYYGAYLDQAIDTARTKMTP